jgi:hypothetical protein
VEVICWIPSEVDKVNKLASSVRVTVAAHRMTRFSEILYTLGGFEGVSHA